MPSVSCPGNGSEQKRVGGSTPLRKFRRRAPGKVLQEAVVRRGSNGDELLVDIAFRKYDGVTVVRPCACSQGVVDAGGRQRGPRDTELF